MEPETTRGPNGCVIALAVVGVLAICGLIAAGSVGYFAYSIYQSRQTLEKERAARADTSAAASVSSKADIPRLTALPPPVVAMSADKAIVRDEVLNVDGDYHAKAPVVSGKYRLSEIDLGNAADFAAFEHEGSAQRNPPLEFVFTVAAADGKSPGETIYVTANSYRLTREGVAFSAYDARIGKISFTGAIDPAFLIRLDDANHSPAFEDSAVMTGDLSVGDQVVKGVGFSYLLSDPQGN